ncbi:ATP-dependent Clp protease adaptor ClpS [Actinophytocola sp.]|uniref:ATP-dependent Clp protease adaptor ClpS n=1 Tax=Actinophytocola sp. TaxID=1872138 RepID=UPI002ED278BB
MWRVVIHNDQLNSLAVVAHLLHTLCAMALPDAVQLAAMVHYRTSAEVAEFPSQGEAEQLVVAFQRHGLDASVRHG